MRGRISALVTSATALAAALLIAAPAGAVSNTPPRSLAACAGGKVSARCESGALADFARARAKEGLAPMVLPTNFARLSPAAQLFALTNIDRVDHGRRPIAALNTRLNAIARTGARRRTDPAFPAGNYAGGSNYADVVGSSLYSEYEWMYNDGFGSHNVDCTSKGSAGCWGHRRNVLAAYPGVARMGVGRVGSRLAEILMGPAPQRYRKASLTWHSVARRIPVGVSTHTLAHPGTLKVYASGLAMTVRASTTGHWTVSKKKPFRLRAGHQATLRLSGSGAGVLRLKGPHGTVRVRLG